MDQVLRQIYADASNGKLSPQEALEKIKAIKLHAPKKPGVLLVTPVWQTSELTTGSDVGYAEHHVIPVQAFREKSDAQRYRECALACFERIQAILRGKPQGRVLVQIVTDDALLAGLSGMLKTAGLENPQFFGQIILVPPQMTLGERAQIQQEEKTRGFDPLVTYEHGVRLVRRWQEVADQQNEPPVAFKDDGVYLITGGLGALGLLFVKEIFDQTRQARVVLTGRSELTAEKQTLRDGLPAGRVTYRQVDLAGLDQVEQLIASITSEHGQLNGILHCAGMTADNFILKKSSDEFGEVLAPKVTGTFNLDRASRDVALDFFVLFSSFAGAMGNVGQADYAAANGFMDQFASHRNREVAAGRRHGRTRSINWSLWQDGGMSIEPASLELLQQSTGIRPMQTATGMRAFYRCLALRYDQTLVVEGELAQMRRALLAAPATPSEAQGKRPERAAISPENLASKTQEFLRRQFSSLLKLPAHRIDPEAALEQYGIDSILAMKLTSQLEQTFGTLSKTLFFEYQTVDALTEYFVQSQPERLAALFEAPVEAALLEMQHPLRTTAVSRRRASRSRSINPPAATESESIAIIGLSGRYPEAVNIEAYWRNLREGKDCIVEVPKDRWDWREYYSDDRTESGRHYSKWGGFIDGVAEFDPLFFNISPKEAKFMDPQERLFLQHAWMAVEDAGYTRASMQVPCEDDLAGQTGVYAGLMYTEYQLFGADASARGNRLGIVGSAASIANRVSYALNLHGPSMTLDTMCSSSLTAIHLACQDLKQGRTSLAIAGGVNVSIHPNKYLVLSAGQFISSDGHCQSFGEGGDGYIPGEGVGVVVLKRLSEAERDGDHIYGIIRGSALNHGGRTNGVTVPNPHAQASAIGRALAESHTDARHISYIEAHGTGTTLGDPIEITALTKAFSRYTSDTGFCLIGSAKSNIGHCESAAGIAGVTKVLLQMQHREIVPSLHSAQLNPHIDFPRSPFVVNQTLRSWEQPVIDGRTLPRIAGISSFGAGGSNAHLIIEEYSQPVREPRAFASVAVVLSARTAEQLQQKARDLLEVVHKPLNAIDLVSMAYTLQLGREAMEERLAFEVSSLEQLAEKLQAYVAGGEDIDGTYQGQVKRNKEALSVFSTDGDLQQAVDKWMEGGKLSKLLDMWVKGLELDWRKLYEDVKPNRVSLPTYPFAKERYWIDTAGAPAAARGIATAVLHPLLHSNTSDLDQQSYSSTFAGDELFLKERILSPAAYLEMARAAVERAARAAQETSLELRDVVWAQLFAVESGQITIALFKNDDEQIDWEIYSEHANEEIVHCRGRAALSHQPAPARLDLEQIERQMGQGRSLARLRLPNTEEYKSGDYVLHPTLIDGALQAALGLIDKNETRMLDALESLRIVSPCTSEMVAWVRYSPGGEAVDIDICDQRGNVSVQLRGIRWQQISQEIPKPVAAPRPVRTEIAFVPRALEEPAFAGRMKPAGIALTLPNASVPSVAGWSAGRPRIALSNAGLGIPAQGSAPSAAYPIRLFDCGDGIFSIEIAASQNRDVIAHLRQALDRVQQEASLMVLMLSGVERCFWSEGREQYNDAIEQKLYQAIVSFPYPMVAALHGNTIGAGYMAAALCDFIVCNEEASYGYTDAQSGFYPTGPEAALFSERFDRAQAEDFLYMSAASTGKQWREKGWTCPILPGEEVESYAQELASALSAKSQDALRLLKQHLARRLTGLVNALAPVEAAVPAEEPAGTVAVIRYGRTGAKDLVADLSQHKAIVLVCEDEDVPDDVVTDLQRLIIESEIPVVAALPENARGNAWLVSQFCDACVYSRTGNYSAGVGRGLAQTAVAFFTHRLGNNAGREVLLTGSEYSGLDLQQRAGTLMVTEHDHVLPAAMRVAEYRAGLPRPTLAAWKKQTAATLQEMVQRLPACLELQDDASDGLPATPTLIPLRSSVVSVTAHPKGVVVVKMEEREARNMFSDAFVEGVTEAFAHIAKTPAYKVVVLTGYDSYFAAGGTKESLLAIQEGKAKFTDVMMFQLPLDCRLPVIAAMQGHGLGAGWAMGMFADLALMSEESRYVSPYMNFGFTPGAGATLILADKIGPDLARESLFTGRYYTGSELRKRGLRLPILRRSEVYPAAMALAGRIAQAPAGHLISLKRQLTQHVREALEETYRLELDMHARTFVGRPVTLARIRINFYSEIEPHPAEPPATVSTPRAADAAIEPQARPPAAGALPAVAATLKALLASELQMRESDIDENIQFVDLGLDSISGVTWIRKINEKYQTSIEATKVYNYPTLAALSRYVREEAEKQGTLSIPPPAPVIVPPVVPETATRPALARLTSRRSRAVSRVAAGTSPTRQSQPIAVVGMAGQFPQAKDVDELWRNLAEGRNCITEVPRERWDVSAYYQPGAAVAGKTNSRWLGALEQYDRFDPLFFNISPAEAELMDPQQRLFLQACWHSIENAGYDARVLSGSKCGVFVGCAAGDYQQLSRQRQLTAQGFTGNAMSILAARISYFLNLQGPCVSIDTACSSSLVAIAQACDSLISGGSDLALAGGVCVIAGPEMHIMTAQAGMLSPEGKCFTFDERADGFVPGEGVGVVLLKRLADAERDRDIIHGVIEGWGVNQDGKTNGITAPNPDSQTRLMQGIYDKYEIDPADIQLIESHGTATKLGDPIEVEGLKTSFKKYTEKKNYCAVGSVKSNIGHCLTAAGIAGVIKLLLALEHKQLPPTINFERLNEHIDLKDSPFYVNSRLQEWKVNGTERRQSAISAFGFSGTNAHIVIGEYLPPVQVKRLTPAKTIIPLSARTAEQLTQKARDLLELIRRNVQSADLMEIAYTLQVGRRAMDERLGFVVSSVEQLAEKLQAYVAGEGGIEDAYQGQAKHGKATMGIIGRDDDLAKTVVEKWIAEEKLSKLLELWVNGLDLDWNALYGDIKPQRIRLPLYPFAKERYWIEATANERPGANGALPVVLHPLLHRNTSDLSEQRYTSTFTGEESFVLDHAGHKVLRAVACLEMARAALARALPAQAESAILELRDTVWARPIVVDDNTDVSIALVATGNEQIDYEIYSHDIVHCHGRAVWSCEPAPDGVDLEQLRTEGQRLLDLRLTDALGDMVLQPTLLDGALQAAVPAALDTLRIVSPCTPEMIAWVRYAPDGLKLDIDLCNPSGSVCVQLRGFSSREPEEATAGSLLATPAWQTSAAGASKVDYAEHHVILCEMQDIGASSFGTHIQCLSLEAEQTQTIAQRYSDYAHACFERIHTIFQSKPQGRVLIQVVVPDQQEQVLLAGLSGLLKTAALENPLFNGQVILVPPGMAAEELRGRLEDERSYVPDALIRYEHGTRQILRWDEVVEERNEPAIAFKDHGVYLTTGGLGALGILFAREILEHANEAHVVLTGRSALSAGKQVILDALSAHYRQVDLGDLDQVQRLIAGIHEDYGQLDGILHCAGMNADSLIVNKGSAEFRDVLAPKVTGTYNLDQATKDVEVDFFVLFSSIAGALGNLGQADYAAANGFMDQFAAYRNRQVAARQRHGRTRSINWPLWQAGAMAIDPASLELLRKTMGVLPMQTATGLRAFYRSLALSHDQVLVAEGIREQITAYLQKVRIFEPLSHIESRAPQLEPAVNPRQLLQDIKDIVAAVVRMDPSVIDVDQPFVEFGLDSFLGAGLIVEINKRFGTELSHSRLFDYSTVKQLSQFLEREVQKRPVNAAQTAGAPADRPHVPVSTPILKRAALSGRRTTRSHERSDDKIAIIGMSGRYPMANDLNEYWRNLAGGRNSIVEVPPSRWNVLRHYDPVRTAKNKTYSKWLGALDDIDRFDPLFFRISPQEAEYIDPQQRLFLQESYRAFEDAGYSTVTLSNRKCGVYLGISTNEYMSLLSRHGIISAPVTSNSPAIAAARIAYYLNLKGPAISVDTACSSSLVAIHLASQAILNHEIDMAVAGGVTLWLSPESYVAMSQAGMFSPEGQCKTFDDSADGIVNGEGVGAVVLKRLRDAQNDGDVIYGVILGSGINQDGRTNGITAPSVNSQIELERALYARYEIDPETIGYVETHGTGTKLGDPIELEALATVFKEKTDRKNFCALGSVKSNIGHTTSAAGVAGLQKVLLSMRNRTLVPTLNVTRENSRFDFESSPFYISRETKTWDVAPGSLRRAALSSFGFSGTNAHLVIEEYPSLEQTVPLTDDGPYIVPLSARSAEQLREKSRNLLDCILTAQPPPALASVAYTLQVGREPMEERVGFVVSSVEQLAQKLSGYVSGAKTIEGSHQNRVEHGGDGMGMIGRDEDMQEAIDKWVARKKLAPLLDWWTRGLNVDWDKLYGEVKPRRVSLPGYPFARERCWIDETSASREPVSRVSCETEMKSIEDIFNQIEDGTIETGHAVQALKILV